MILQNNKVKFIFDDKNGNLLSIENINGVSFFDSTSLGGTVFNVDTTAKDLWDARPESKGIVRVKESDAIAKITSSKKEGEEVLVIEKDLEVNGGILSVKNVFTLKDNEGIAKVNTYIENKTGGVLITTERFPIEGKIDNDVDLFWPMRDGVVYDKVFESGKPNRFDPFGKNILEQFEDYPNVKEDRREDPYPAPMFLQCFGVTKNGQSLYYGIHDKEVIYKDFVLEKKKRIYITEYPFVNPNESYEFPEMYLGVTDGDWHTVADYYRNFLVNESGLMRKPMEMGKKMLGMSCICCSTYPDIPHLKYSDDVVLETELGASDFKTRDLNFPSLGTKALNSLPKVAKYAKDNSGIPLTLFIGWSRGGLDAYYPDYDVQEVLGGEEALKKGLQKIHEDGGQAIFYVNVHIANSLSRWYNELNANGVKNWEECAIRKADGGYIGETYDTTNLSFVAMCPMAKDWQDALIKAMRKVRSAGCDGIYMDQMSEMTTALCYNKNHGHKTPATAYREGYRLLNQRINQMMREYGDNYIMSCEGGLDAYMSYVDIFGMNWRRRLGLSWRPTMQPEVIRYCLPTNLLGMHGFAEVGDDMGARAFTLFEPPLTCPSFYNLTRRYVTLYDKYPEIYNRGRYMHNIGLSGVEGEMHYGMCVADDKLSAIIHLYNYSIEGNAFTMNIDAEKICGQPVKKIRITNAETGKKHSKTEKINVIMKGKEKLAIHLKFEV